jgi:hypothetical protein
LLYCWVIATQRAEAKMPSRPTKLLICALCFAAMAASSAQAAQKMRKPAAPQATAGSAVPCRGANLFHCGPVYNGNDYLGSDPDPFIRLMIQRNLGAKYGGSP